jgi:hypothetical protein
MGRKGDFVGQESRRGGATKERGPKTALTKQLAHLLAPSTIGETFLIM